MNLVLGLFTEKKKGKAHILVVFKDFSVKFWAI